MPAFSPLEHQAIARIMALRAVYEKEIASTLLGALQGIYGVMTSLYHKYATDGVLSKAEMTRYNQMAYLSAQIDQNLDPATAQVAGTLTRLPPEVYGATFFNYAWAIDVTSGLRLSWGVLNLDSVTEALANSYDKISVERYGTRARKIVKAAVADGLTIGESYPQMAKRLKAALNTVNFRALMIARTEGQTAVNAGQNDLYGTAKELGVDGHEVWDATLDLRTRPDHQLMDGQVKNDQGLFTLPDGETAPYPAWDGLSAGERINCRCSTHFQIDDYAPALRRTRDEGVLPYQTYEQWAKGRVTWGD